MYTLLLTGTITPSQNVLFLNITDPEIRYKQYIETIVKYIIFSCATHIIFCENSNHPFPDKECLINLANIFGKSFELISFNGDHQKTVEKGRGFGESEIIEYALTNSSYLQTAPCFTKVTGRYRCANIDTIISQTQSKRLNAFSLLLPMSFKQLIHNHTINTAVYTVTTDFYKKILQGVGNDVDDSRIYFLEHAFYDRLHPYSSSIIPLPVYPKLRGVTGQGSNLQRHWIIEFAKQLLHHAGITRL